MSADEIGRQRRRSKSRSSSHLFLSPAWRVTLSSPSSPPSPTFFRSSTWPLGRLPLVLPAQPPLLLLLIHQPSRMSTVIPSIPIPKNIPLRTKMKSPTMKTSLRSSPPPQPRLQNHLLLHPPHSLIHSLNHPHRFLSHNNTFPPAPRPQRPLHLHFLL